MLGVTTITVIRQPGQWRAGYWRPVGHEERISVHASVQPLGAREAILSEAGGRAPAQFTLYLALSEPELRCCDPRGEYPGDRVEYLGRTLVLTGTTQHVAPGGQRYRAYEASELTPESTAVQDAADRVLP